MSGDLKYSMSKKIAEYPGAASIALQQGMLRAPQGSPSPKGGTDPQAPGVKEAFTPLEQHPTHNPRLWHSCPSH